MGLGAHLLFFHFTPSLQNLNHNPLISTYMEALVEKEQSSAFPYFGEPLEEEI